MWSGIWRGFNEEDSALPGISAEQLNPAEEAER
jgi:hypothetical protein